MAPRQTNKLSAATVETLTTPGRHGDGGGLYLSISPMGARSWVFMWKVDGKRSEMGLGSLRDVTLATAREKAAEARRNLANDIDPLTARTKTASTFFTRQDLRTRGWTTPQITRFLQKPDKVERSPYDPPGAQPRRLYRRDRVLAIEGRLSFEQRRARAYVRPAPMPDDPLDRFFAKCSPEPNSGCWIWTSAVNSNGYGVTRYEGKMEAAHRVAWRLYRGEIPPKMFVCHTCDTPLCANPDHLFIGTVAENHRDMDRKGRRRTGSKYPEALKEKVRSDPRPYRVLAEEYGLTYLAVKTMKAGNVSAARKA